MSIQLYHVNLFNVQIHFDENAENNCFLFRQHCGYLIVSVNIEFIYKITIFVHHFSEIFFYKNEMRDKQMKKQKQTSNQMQILKASQ